MRLMHAVTLQYDWKDHKKSWSNGSRRQKLETYNLFHGIHLLDGIIIREMMQLISLQYIIYLLKSHSLLENWCILFPFKLFILADFFLSLFLYCYMMYEMHEVGDFDTMDCTQHLLFPSDWSKGEGPCLLPHLPVYDGEDASRPNLDHPFTPSNCQRQKQNRWQGHWVWTSWSRKQLVRAKYIS